MGCTCFGNLIDRQNVRVWHIFPPQKPTAINGRGFAHHHLLIRAPNVQGWHSNPGVAGCGGVVEGGWPQETEVEVGLPDVHTHICCLPSVLGRGVGGQVQACGGGQAVGAIVVFAAAAAEVVVDSAGVGVPTRTAQVRSTSVDIISYSLLAAAAAAAVAHLVNDLLLSGQSEVTQGLWRIIIGDPRSFKYPPVTRFSRSYHDKADFLSGRQSGQ